MIFVRSLAVIPSFALAILISNLLAAPMLIAGVTVCLQIIFMELLDHFTLGRTDRKIKNLDEEILKDEKECADVEAEIARIQVTIDKIDMSNKFTEEKIAIIRDAIKQLEEKTSPEGAQKVIQVEPANCVECSNNQKTASSHTHNLVLN
ncbi:MAG: hypothetical protein K2L98_01045 [Bacilli bacterium]|nr:hypothetical protein [Bacilli bacterium]